MIKRLVTLSFLTALHIWSLQVTLAQGIEDSLTPGNRYVKAQVVADSSVIQPGASPERPSARVGIKFEIEPGWHIYWKNSGDSGAPTKIKWHLPEGWKTGELRWPTPQQLTEDGAITTFGYTNEVLLIADLFAPSVEIGSGESVTVGADITFLVCEEQCFPGRLSVSNVFPFSIHSPLEPSADYLLFSKYEALVPKPPSILQHRERTRNIAIKPLLSAQKLISGRQAQLGIFVTNLYTPHKSVTPTLLQVFPEGHPQIKLGLAEVSLIGSSKCGLTGCFDYLITLPVDVFNSAPEEAVELKGILALAPEIYAESAERSSDPLSVEWSLKTVIGDANTTAVANPQFDSIVTQAESTARLTFLSKPSKQRKIATDPESQPVPSLAKALILALIAGLILNLMPCVLPILSIKVVSFAKHAHLTRREKLLPALAYATGILASFAVLAMTVIILKDLGKAVGWGFQFQHPAYVLTLLLVVFLLSLGFFDLFEFRVPGINSANRAVASLEPSLLSHFFDGVLATALSTPCTAPFLGTALAFALSQSALATLLIFLAIGTGLALPYVLLSASPLLGRLLPKPGAWMIKLRQMMGFCLLATVVWLLFILHRQTEEGVVWAIALMLGIFIWIWIARWLAAMSGKALRSILVHISLASMLLFASVKLWPSLTAPRSRLASATSGSIQWREYSDDRVSESLMAGRGVFIDFTADWCVTCKVNETLVLNQQKFAALLAKYQVIPFKADWTNGDEAVTQALRRYRGQGVPHYVVISPAAGGKFEVLPTILTHQTLENSFDSLLSNKQEQ